MIFHLINDPVLLCTSTRFYNGKKLLLISHSSENSSVICEIVNVPMSPVKINAAKTSRNLFVLNPRSMDECAVFYTCYSF